MYSKGIFYEKQSKCLSYQKQSNCLSYENQIEATRMKGVLLTVSHTPIRANVLNTE